MRDALRLIARSSADAQQHSPARQTLMKPAAAPCAAAVTPVTLVGRLLPPHTASLRSQNTAASPAECALATMNRTTSRAPVAALLESPVHRRQAALTDLQAAKDEMACAMQHLRACALDLRVQLPAEAVSVPREHSP